MFFQVFLVFLELFLVLIIAYVFLIIVEDTKIEDIKGNKTSTIFYTSLSWDTIVLRAAPK